MDSSDKKRSRGKSIQEGKWKCVSLLSSKTVSVNDSKGDNVSHLVTEHSGCLRGGCRICRKFDRK